MRNRKKKYRHFLLWCLGLDLLAIALLGYRYLERKIPDEIQVAGEDAAQVSEVLSRPYLSVADTITVASGGGYTLECELFGFIPYKQIKVTPASSENVFVSGSVVGIYMETEGVLVIDTGEILTDGGVPEEPAKNLVKPGDYIVGFNEAAIRTKQDLIKDLEDLTREDVTLSVRRNGETIPVSMTPVKDSKGNYKLGLWVRDDTQGIGTLTYVDEEGRYGALGHGISDVDTGELLNIKEGDLYRAQVLAIQKGSKGMPGELAGLIRYDPANIIGTIQSNTGNGIYGSIEITGGQTISLKSVPVGYKQELEIGPATILSCVDGTVKEYEAQITRIDMNHEDSNKSFVIQITDQELLEKTGGIVQGMSGSPVLQKGKFMGAVTHVFVQDSTAGYGIFAETMLKQA